MAQQISDYKNQQFDSQLDPGIFDQSMKAVAAGLNELGAALQSADAARVETAKHMENCSRDLYASVEGADDPPGQSGRDRRRSGQQGRCARRRRRARRRERAPAGRVEYSHPQCRRGDPSRSPIRPICWRSMPRSKRHAPARRGAALPWWPTRCAQVGRKKRGLAPARSVPTFRRWPAILARSPRRSTSSRLDVGAVSAMLGKVEEFSVKTAETAGAYQIGGRYAAAADQDLNAMASPHA